MWHTTYGQINDLIKAYEYKTYLTRIEAARAASYFAYYNNGGKSTSLTELVGVWVDGKIITQEEANDYYLEKARSKLNG